MSTSTTLQVAALQPAVDFPAGSAAPAQIWSQFSARFWKFLEKLPEHHEDIDFKAPKRVPVPIRLFDRRL